MGKPRIPVETEDKILAMYLQTGKMKETSKAFGIAWSTLYRILYDRGVPRGYGREIDIRRRRALTDDQESEIARRHAVGEKAERLAKEFGCSHWLVKKVVKRSGGEFHPRGNSIRRLSTQECDSAIALYRSGHTQEGVAAIIGCSQIVVSRAMRARGVRVRKSAATGPDHGSWKGGVAKANGYLVEVLSEGDAHLRSMARPDGYALQHRLVMARSLGRPLGPSETVHHINGIKTDNRIENLQLRQGKHGNGVRHACADCGSHNVVAVELGRN
jgi:hypothetical protein